MITFLKPDRDESPAKYRRESDDLGRMVAEHYAKSGCERYAKDAEGHEHKPAGPGGGQFTGSLHASLKADDSAAEKFAKTGQATAFRIHNGSKPLPKKSRNSWSDDEDEMPGVSGLANFSNALEDMLLGVNESVTGENYTSQTPNPVIVVMQGKYVDGPGAEVVVPNPKIAAVFTRAQVEAAQQAVGDDLGEIERHLLSSLRGDKEHYARGGRGLFDESKIERDDLGQFASKGEGASIADESFTLGQAPAKKGKSASHEHQGSLFDKDLHGAEARDLPGQTNFIDKPPRELSDQEKSEQDYADNFNSVSADPPKATSRNLHRAQGFIAQEIRHQGRRLERGDIPKQAHDDLVSSLERESEWYGQILKDRGDYAGGGPYSDEKPNKRRYSADGSGIDKSDSPTAQLGAKFAEEFKSRGL